MKCPSCGRRGTHVYGGYDRADTYRRYRVCLECGHKFHTVEEVALDVTRGRKRKEVRGMPNMTDAERERLNRIFTYHAPKGDQAARYERIRGWGRLWAIEIAQLCPDSRERSVALTKIQEAVMWANSAIAVNEE
jgi:transcriptional regulator NrdR family protein